MFFIEGLAEPTKVEDMSKLRSIASRVRAEAVKYKNGGKAGNQNCLFCTWSVELQCRGINMLPRPVYSPRDTIFNIDGSSFVTGTHRMSITSKKDVIEKALNAGSGSRFYAHVNWKGSSGGHEFILTCVGARVYVVDGQDGTVEEVTTDKKSAYFDNINYSNSYIRRTDTATLNQKILKYNDKKYIIPWDDVADVEFLKNELGQNA